MIFPRFLKSFWMDRLKTFITDTYLLYFYLSIDDFEFWPWHSGVAREDRGICPPSLRKKFKENLYFPGNLFQKSLELIFKVFSNFFLLNIFKIFNFSRWQTLRWGYNIKYLKNFLWILYLVAREWWIELVLVEELRIVLKNFKKKTCVFKLLFKTFSFKLH